MVIEEPPVRTFTGEDPRSHRIVAISARSSSALKTNKEVRSINTSMHRTMLRI
jgi:hypothetical protein